MPYEKARAQLNKGQARPTLFRVFIQPNAQNGQFGANDYLEFFCKTAAIPAISHQTVSVNGHHRVGVVRQQPSSVIFGKPFDIQVIERSDMIVYDNIKKWFDKTSIGSNSRLELSQRMSYYDTYTCDIILEKYEYSSVGSDFPSVSKQIAQGKATPDGFVRPLTVTFKNAYPTQVGAISLASDAQNTPLTFSVSFNYETYHTVVEQEAT